MTILYVLLVLLVTMLVNTITLYITLLYSYSLNPMCYLIQDDGHTFYSLFHPGAFGHIANRKVQNHRFSMSCILKIIKSIHVTLSNKV